VAGPKDEHAPALAALGVPADAIPALSLYLETVARWNLRTNLTGAVSAQERVSVLVADPWRAIPHIAAGRLIDVGSGNGSPGLVLALLRTDRNVVLLEPRARRWAFLREVVRELARADIEVERCRSDQYTGPPAATVTVRAVGVSVGRLAPLVAEGGEVLQFGGQPTGIPPLVPVGTHRLQSLDLHVFRRPAPNVSRET
jgi:16S rRNA (guanine527-N7)-methyltransferase